MEPSILSEWIFNMYEHRAYWAYFNIQFWLYGPKLMVEDSWHPFLLQDPIRKFHWAKELTNKRDIRVRTDKINKYEKKHQKHLGSSAGKPRVSVSNHPNMKSHDIVFLKNLS